MSKMSLRQNDYLRSLEGPTWIIIHKALLSTCISHATHLVRGQRGGEVVTVEVTARVDVREANCLATLDWRAPIAEGAACSPNAPVAVTVFHCSNPCYGLLPTTCLKYIKTQDLYDSQNMMVSKMSNETRTGKKSAYFTLSLKVVSMSEGVRGLKVWFQNKRKHKVLNLTVRVVFLRQKLTYKQSIIQLRFSFFYAIILDRMRNTIIMTWQYIYIYIRRKVTIDNI